MHAIHFFPSLFFLCFCSPRERMLNIVAGKDVPSRPESRARGSARAPACDGRSTHCQRGRARPVDAYEDGGPASRPDLLPSVAGSGVMYDKKSPEGRLRPLIDAQCGPLLMVLTQDVMGIVYEYLFAQQQRNERGEETEAKNQQKKQWFEAGKCSVVRTQTQQQWCEWSSVFKLILFGGPLFFSPRAFAINCSVQNLWEGGR